MPPRLYSSQACRACRRLKRKCTREVPKCSLCHRLGKACEYAEPIAAEAASRIDQALHVGTISPYRMQLNGNTAMPLPRPTQEFPLAFFLDSDELAPQGVNAFSWSRQLDIRGIVAEHLEDDRAALCEEYLSTVHEWIPMVSRKRLFNELHNGSDDADGCLPILLLCMKAFTTRDPNGARDSSSYLLARSLCSEAESAGFLSLRLVQSLILLAAYELSHAIYPVAYSTLGRASRLGLLLGLHDRKNNRLFKSAETWTLREEQRRTWWAIFLLDRLMSIETNLPITVPEPARDELLPINDDDWDEGKIVPSEPLFTTSFSSLTSVGSFAKMCQAAHMLSRVMHHKASKKALQEVENLLPEAQALHSALSALHSSIEGHISGGILRKSAIIALSLCSSARLILYNLYGCNEPGASVEQSRIAMETEMQKASLDGIRSISSNIVPAIARANIECPLIAQCLYHSATECAWFVREDHEAQMYNALEDIVRDLKLIGENWNVATEYLALLHQAGVLNLISSETASNTLTPSSG